MVLQDLLQLGESYHQEFKETIDKSSDLLHRIGHIEKIGTGIKRIRDPVAKTTNCSVLNLKLMNIGLQRSFTARNCRMSPTMIQG
mgnify:CR=1 FL=1